MFEALKAERKKAATMDRLQNMPADHVPAFPRHVPVVEKPLGGEETLIGLANIAQPNRAASGRPASCAEGGAGHGIRTRKRVSPQRFSKAPRLPAFASPAQAFLDGRNYDTGTHARQVGQTANGAVAETRMEDGKMASMALESRKAAPRDDLSLKLSGSATRHVPEGAGFPRRHPAFAGESACSPAFAVHDAARSLIASGSTNGRLLQPSATLSISHFSPSLTSGIDGTHYRPRRSTMAPAPSLPGHMAEPEGFEPPQVATPVRHLKPLHSTALPRLPSNRIVQNSFERQRMYITAREIARQVVFNVMLLGCVVQLASLLGLL